VIRKLAEGLLVILLYYMAFAATVLGTTLGLVLA
jgi:hypothetical protein